MVVILQQIVLIKSELDRTCKKSRNPFKRLYRNIIIKKLLRKVEYLRDVVLDIGTLSEFGEFCKIIGIYTSNTIEVYMSKFIELDDISIRLRYDKNKITVRYTSIEGHSIEKIYDNGEISYTNATNTDDEYTRDIIIRLHDIIYNSVVNYIKS